MRALLIAHNVYSEPTNGAARSVRTMMEWLAAAGHQCHAVGTGRFEQSPVATIAGHHDALPVPVTRVPGPRDLVRYRLNGVQITAVESEHATRVSEDVTGTELFSGQIDLALQAQPELVLAYGSHPAVHAGLAAARAQGARTVFTVRGWGYDDPAFYAHADRVLFNSSTAAQHYARTACVQGDWLPSPLVWADIVAPEDTRGFVTFVNPSPHKGLALFARLADMLGRRRPDIPILIVQTGREAAALATIPGLDLARHPQILVSPPLPTPRDIYALTRILLVPSVFAEPFGRVAAEALINGIPPIVSDRGALPETVGDGGITLPLPAWLTPFTTAIPTQAETQPWFDAVTRLWDDPEYEAGAIARARRAGARLYNEASLRRRTVEYLTKP